jgi:hypothetical protein
MVQNSLKSLKIQKFFQDISNFFRNFKVLPEFCIAFCPTVKILGLKNYAPPAHTPPAQIWISSMIYLMQVRSCDSVILCQTQPGTKFSTDLNFSH